MKDFLAVSGPLHVSHMCVFTSTDMGTYLKIVRTPRGPTLYFKVLNYSLTKDVISSVKKQYVFEQQFLHPPLLILNNFSGEETRLKLMTSMLQNMFPTITLFNINLNNVRRCVLFNYNSQSGEIDFRHYAIKVMPINISKGVKKMIQNKVPDLSRFSDTTDFILRADILSESEGEDDPESHVILPQKISTRGNLSLHQSSIRLLEQGPRMTLQLFKIEEGFLSGEVLYHKNIAKTEEEKVAILQKRLEKRYLKEARKKEQEEKKKRKELAKQLLRKKSIEGQNKANEKNNQIRQMTKKDNIYENGNNTNNDDDDDDDDDNQNDVEWYRTEVGKEPEKGLFATKIIKNRSTQDLIKSKRKKRQKINIKSKKLKIK